MAALNRNQVKKITIDVLSKNLGMSSDTIKESSTFESDLGGDSLDIVELILALEEAFDITIDDGQIVKLTTVGKIIDYITSLKPENKDYMKTAIQLRMIKDKSNKEKFNKFKAKHKKLSSKMTTIK